LKLHTNLDQSTRVLVLLLDNAQKFLTSPAEAQDDHRGVGNVWLKVDKISEGTIRFTIEDTGIGVPANEAERIFDDFVQLNEYYDGVGIGLTIARSIARRLGGDVTLDTTCQKGARLYFTLPLTDAGARPQTAE
jgi:signal transduction histidine kinase